jgi:hypothetical protein
MLHELDDGPLTDALQEVISVSVQQASVITGHGLTRIHQLIKTGELESFLDGGRRRIPLRSIKRRRDRLLAEAAANRNPPPRHDGLPPARRGEKRKRGLETRAQANAEATT